MTQSYAEQQPRREVDDKSSDGHMALPAKPPPQSKTRSSSEDLVFGQPVIVTMRWILVASGLILVLLNPDDLALMRVQIVVLLILAMANFYLHSQLLIKRPVLDPIIYAASAADLFLVLLLIIVGNGFESNLYVYFFPAIVSFAVVFPTVWTLTYVASTMAMYGFISLVTVGDGDPLIILARLLMIAAIGFGGNQYLRIERSRRQAAIEAQVELKNYLRQQQATAPTRRPVSQSQ
jgi:hypothetical protein